MVSSATPKPLVKTPNNKKLLSKVVFAYILATFQVSLWPEMTNPLTGIEPSTVGLKGHCTTIVLQSLGYESV